MTMRRVSVVAVMIVCLGAVVLAQEREVPLANWAAPPYWQPSADAREAVPEDEMQATAQDLRSGTAQATLPSSPLPFTAITACRVADTRGNGFTGAYGPPALAGGGTRSFTIAGQCGIPSGAVAVSFNFAITGDKTRAGDLRFYPAGGALPLVATIYWEKGTGIVGNAAVVPLGDGGAITVKNDSPAPIDLIIDVNGYYAPMLPFSGSASSALGTDIFTIRNTGMGRAMHAIAAGDVTLLAENDAGIGIKATTGSGIAAYFAGYHGVEAYGSEYGGYFKDSTPDDTGWAKLGVGHYGVEAYGYAAGGLFNGDFAGITASAVGASGSGGVFSGAIGVQAYGTEWGAFFWDFNDSGRAFIASGDLGIDARGDVAGGYFQNSSTGGTGWAKLGVSYYGVEAYGYSAGGLFNGDFAGITASAVGASGSGGVFSGAIGVQAYGNEWGASFGDFNDSGRAFIASGDLGIDAQGGVAGGYFGDTDSSAYAYVGSDTYKIYGSGTVNFVQNHPYDRSRVIVYSAPEGDEVATYTRGTARLVNGEARVPLGETFAWVTNPDLGLSAYLTPVGGWCDLYVAEKGTSELLVRSRDGTDCSFDYLVYGLRIGFEESTVVQEKRQESYIPSMKSHRELIAKRPELRQYTALARFGREREAVGAMEPPDLSRAAALKAAIHEFDPAVDRIESVRPPVEVLPSQPAEPGASPRESSAVPSGSIRPSLPSERPDSQSRVVTGEEAQDIHARSFSSPREQLATRVLAAGEVEPGDVLVVDREQPERFVRSERGSDPTVVGVVVGEAGVALGARQEESGTASVALSGIVRCKVDASFGAVAPGDLLVSAPTPGHAMRDAAPLPGTVVGKALEPLASGTGTINVLVMLR